MNKLINLHLYLLGCIFFIAIKANAAPLQLTFKCEAPPVEFTLGENSNPSEADLNKLCNCLNSKMSDKSKQTNLNIKTKKDVPLNEAKSLINEFGKLMMSCGASSL